MNKVKSAFFIVALFFVSQIFLSVNGSTIVLSYGNPVKCDNGKWDNQSTAFFSRDCNTIKIHFIYNGEYDTLRDQKNVCKYDIYNKQAVYKYVTIHHPGRKDTYDLRFDKCQLEG